MQYTYPMFLGEVSEDELWDIININVGATTMMTRLLIGQMEKRGKGAIVNVSSGSELAPLPLMTVYAATKVYIKSFSDALRAEYSRFGLTIQHLAPFFVSTKMNAFSDRLQVTRRRGARAELFICRTKHRLILFPFITAGVQYFRAECDNLRAECNHHSRENEFKHWLLGPRDPKASHDIRSGADKDEGRTVFEHGFQERLLQAEKKHLGISRAFF